MIKIIEMIKENLKLNEKYKVKLCLLKLLELLQF